MRSRSLAFLTIVLAAGGCTARQQPRPPALTRDAAPIPLVVGVCPDAARAEEWLVRDPLFARVVPLAGATADVVPQLVVVAADAAYTPRYFQKPRRTSTRVTSIFSLLSLGILPTYFRHEGFAEVTFRRPAPGGAPCTTDPADEHHVVRVEPGASELLAFWFVVPALVAALPGWDLKGGDDPPPHILQPGRWLPAAIARDRAALLRLAGSGGGR